MGKTHYGKCTITNVSPVHKSFNEESWSKPLCGLDYAPRQTQDKNKVTCIRCLRALEDLEEREQESCNLADVINCPNCGSVNTNGKKGAYYCYDCDKIFL